MTSIIQKPQPVRTIFLGYNQNTETEINVGSYGNVIMIGYVGNIGSVILGLYKSGSTLAVVDLTSENAFSSSYVQFSTDEDKIIIRNTTGNQNIIVTLVYGGVNIC